MLITNRIMSLRLIGQTVDETAKIPLKTFITKSRIETLKRIEFLLN